ncbi:PucR family transcriptional regulator ligand-binding domain-containing protein [Streptomyces flavalbus]|uniref:PucR family transcriptional regulator ligand-binding domain-containing protein n=1 Tax=Streptomyces flavalbus TaxID=2665155 RepID=A0ABW2W8Y4_9ACTN
MTVPPTPPVPLADLLAREDLALRRIAGPADVSGVVIHGAHASEMPDPYPYLLGGELLLTAGAQLPEAPDAAYFDAYVSRIVAAGGAALGFGLAPVHDTVPAGLVAACEAHGLPLLEVPPRTTFAGVARAVWQLMAHARHAELRRVTEAQQGLAAAASRPDPVPAVLRQLARAVAGWAVLYDAAGERVAAAGRTPEAAGVRTGLRELARRLTARSTTTATDTAEGTDLTAYSLGAARGHVLGVAAARRAPGDHTIASVAAVLLSLLTGAHQGGAAAARSSALVRLLLGAAPEAVAPLLGAESWYVVHAVRPRRAAAGRTPPDPGADRWGTHPPADALAASALGTALGSPLVDLAEDVVRVLVPADREPAPQPGWTLGVSAPVGPADWPTADAQAARALARARATRTPLHHYGTPRLADLVPPAEAEAHARALLAPLTPTLGDTLRAWLSLHGSWDRTAVALGVHRNTVRQRVARCAALLEADLDDPDVRMELWFALRRS